MHACTFEIHTAWYMYVYVLFVLFSCFEVSAFAELDITISSSPYFTMNFTLHLVCSYACICHFCIYS